MIEDNSKINKSDDDLIINKSVNRFSNETIENKNLRNLDLNQFSGSIKISYNIKDYFFALLLLIFPCPNFSYLHIPYYFFGIISIFFLLSNSNENRNKKFILEILCLIYSILSSIFKGICLIVKDLFNIELMIKLGIAIKKNEKDTFYILTTFVPDGTIFIFSIISILITKISKKYISNLNEKINRNKYYQYFSFILWCDFLFISVYSCFTISYLSLAFIILINFPMLLWCFDCNKICNIKIFKFISIIELLIFIILNLFTFYFNIYKFYPNNNLLKIIQKLGIQNMNGDFTIDNMNLWIGYILSNICIVLLITSIKLINSEVEKEEIKEIIIDENDKNKNIIEESTFKSILLFIKNYLSSPSFVLHFTRFGVIFWIYFYRNYASLILIFWLCISFLYTKTSNNIFITKIFAFPSLYYTIIMIHYSNIPFVYYTPSNLNDKIKNEHIGLIKFEFDQRIEYSSLFFVLFLMYIFSYSLVRHIEEKKEKKKDYNIIQNNNNLNVPLIENDKKEKKVISLKNIFLNTIFSNIDKLTLVSMYFVANQFVNFTHVLLVIFFIYQLLSPKKFENSCLYIMILVELIFIVEYVFDLLKVFGKFDKDIIKLFIAYSKNIEKTSIEILLFLAIYCLYIQYQLINSKVYKKLSKEEENESEDNNNISNNIFAKVFYVIKNIFLELYIWIIIVLCFILLCTFEINLLFLFKLFIYLFILYDFLTSIQQKKNLNKFANWIFLMYCAINTLLVYFYQFSRIDIIKDFFDEIYKAFLPKFLIDHFVPIGFIHYKEQLPVKFIPHFGLNFLSILFLRETNRIINFKDNKNKKIKKEEIKIIEDIKLIDELKDNNLIIDNEENKNEEKKERKLSVVKNKISENKMKYKLFQAIIFLTKFYFLLLFLSVCLIITNYDISLAMTFYLSIFGISFLLLFYKNIKLLNNFLVKKSFFLSKLIRYSQIELPSHIESNQYYRSLIFKILLLFSEIYIFLVYSFSTFYIIQHKCDSEGKNCNKNLEEILSKDIEDYISAISYLIGFYINISKNSILKTIKFHLFLFALISFDVYIQRLQNYSIEKTIEIKRKIKSLKREKRDINNLIKKNKNILNNINNKSNNEKELNEDEEEESFFSEISKSRSSSIAIRNKKEINDLEKGFILLKEKFRKIFERASQSKIKLKSSNNSYTIIKGFKNIIEELILFLLLCTSLSKANIISYIYIIISFYFVFKKKNIYQYYVLMNFLVCSIIIQSIFFITNMTEKTDPDPDLEILKIIKEKLNFPWFEKLFNKFKFQNYYIWGFFFGIGIDKNQIKSIWFEFFLISLIYIYLDLFSFSIYQNVVNIGQKNNGTDKINYYNLSKQKKLVNCVKNMNYNDFIDYSTCLKNSFGIYLGNDFSSFKKKFNVDDDNNENYILNENLIKENKIEDKNEEIKKEEILENMPEKDNNEINTDIKINEEKNNNNKNEDLNPLKNILKKSKIREKIKKINIFQKIRALLYLSFHNFIIVIIILISMMISGLISATYFIFSLFFLMESSNLIIGTYFSYPNKIRKNIRIILLSDIFLQLFIQNPISINLRKYSMTEKIEKIIGLTEIIKYENNNIKINSDGLTLIYVKVITLVLINLQVLMYSSKDFQEFYLTYLITKKDKIKKRQMMNTFKFNNKRVEKMNENILRRIRMENAMNSLEKTLEDWNQKLSHINDEKPINLLDNKKKDEDNISVITGGSLIIEENIVREEIKNYILSGFLTKILLFLNKYCSNYFSVEKNRKIYYERDMIKGKTYSKSYLEELIDNELNSLDMSCYKKREIKIIKKILNGEIKNESFEKENLEEEKEINLDNIINKYNNEDLENKSKKNKEKKIDLTLDKFKRIKDLKERELFKKYLKKTTLLISIIRNIINFFIINFNFLCYLMMILNHMISGSFLTLIYPISIFIFAFPQYPRPTSLYWNFCLKYSIFVLIIKFIIQLDCIKLFIPEDIKLFLEFYKFGILIFDSTFSKEFFYYIIYDGLVIIFISIQIIILINLGFWKEREQDIENIYEANERIIKTQDIILKKDDEIIEFNRKFIFKKNNSCDLNSEGLFKDNNNNNLIEEIEEKEKSENSKSKKSESSNSKISIESKRMNYIPNNKFLYNLFPIIRNEKPGSDYYVYYTSIYMIILLYLILFYTSMEQDKTFGAVIEQQKQFSGIMVIFLIIHVIFLICDRIIYIRQNRNNLIYKYGIYNKKTNVPISQNEYEKIKKEIINKYIEQTKLRYNFKIPLTYIDTLNENYKIIFIQHEKINMPLYGKFILHIIITLFSHILIFFYLPFKGNYNIIGTLYCSKKYDQTDNCNNFLDNNYIIIFYILYIIYLSFSSFQIQKGLLDMKKKSILKSGESSINSGIYNGYKNTPFLYEIKLAIDWTFTTTSLDFFQWAKFESVYDTIYLTLCNMKFFKTKKVGLAITLFQKITLGATIWISLILLLILPLLIFSNLNPINELNNVTGAKTSLKISFIKDNVYSNYTLFENSHIEGIEEMFYENDTGKIQWNIFKYNISYMKNYPHDQIQIIYMSDTSDHVWDIAKPHIEKIKDNLFNYSNSDKIELYYEYSFQRPKPAENKDSIKHIDYVIYDKYNSSECKFDILNKLYNAINNCNETEINLNKFYYSPLRLSSSSHPKLIDLLNNKKIIDVILSFHNCKIIKNENELSNKSYSESYFQIKKNISYNKHEGIEFHTFSDKVSSVTSSYSILTFYVSFVLIAGSYVRGFLQGQPEKIILTEMPDTQQLIYLCEGIKTARFSFDLEKEEHLYYVLIELMRSPDYLKLLTKSSLQQFKERRELLKNDS